MAKMDRNFEYYGAESREYDEIVRKAGYSLPKIVFDTVALHRAGAISRVLDLGIGTGLISEAFAHEKSAVVGIDAAPEMLQECAKKGFAESLILADLSEGVIPPCPSQFDLILCVGLIEFVLNPKALFMSVAESMNDTALFVLAIRDISLNPTFTKMRWEEFTIDARAYSDHGLIAIHHDWIALRKYLVEQNFKVVSNEEVFAYISPTQHIQTNNRLVLLSH